MSVLKFSDGMPERKEKEILYPEELLGRTCGECLGKEKKGKK